MRWIPIAALAAGAVASAMATDRGAPPVRELTAAQIIEKNVAARGGLEAWRKIQTMVWTGHMESIHAPMPMMLFMMQQKRPNKTRFEINALGDRTIRVFDGERGWKLKPDQQGKAQVKPFSFEEVTFARAAQVIDGPLIDYLAKGNTVTLEGLDEIEGRKAYRLDVRLATGETDQVWVDAQTFLDVRYDRPFAAGEGRDRVSVFYRDYKAFEGLQVPSVIETSSGPGARPDRMVIERVTLNPPLDDRAFARPRTHGPGAGTAMDSPPAPSARRIPLNSSAAPAPYPFPAQPPSAPAPAAAPGSAPGPAPAAAPAPGPN
jgi:hypothetical protein